MNHCLSNGAEDLRLTCQLQEDAGFAQVRVSPINKGRVMASRGVGFIHTLLALVKRAESLATGNENNTGSTMPTMAN